MLQVVPQGQVTDTSHRSCIPMVACQQSWSGPRNSHNKGKYEQVGKKKKLFKEICIIIWRNVIFKLPLHPWKRFEQL